MDPSDLVGEYANRLMKDSLSYCLFFGSYVYDERFSKDFDVLFATKEEITEDTRQRLIESYFRLHEMFKKVPDRNFPGEYLSEQQILDAQHGKGFGYSDGKVRITRISATGWNEFNDSRHHLTAIGGPTRFIAGNRILLEKHKQICLNTILEVVILSNSLQRFSLEDLVSLVTKPGKEYLGFMDNAFISSYLRRNFAALLQKRPGHVSIIDGQVEILDRSFLDELESRIAGYTEHGGS